MVDVSAKAETHRIARARGSIRMQATTLALIASGSAAKGDVIGIARIAAIQAAKRTAELIPLCHPLPLTRVAVEFEIDAAGNAVHCTAQAETFGRTGVEMEALTAVQVGLLTVYDMCKAADRGMVMGDVRLLEKRGGKSGSWEAPRHERRATALAGDSQYRDELAPVHFARGWLALKCLRGLRRVLARREVFVGARDCETRECAQPASAPCRARPAPPAPATRQSSAHVEQLVRRALERQFLRRRQRRMRLAERSGSSVVGMVAEERAALSRHDALFERSSSELRRVVDARHRAVVQRRCEGTEHHHADPRRLSRDPLAPRVAKAAGRRHASQRGVRRVTGPSRMRRLRAAGSSRTTVGTRACCAGRSSAATSARPDDRHARGLRTPPNRATPRQCQGQQGGHCRSHRQADLGQ